MFKQMRVWLVLTTIYSLLALGSSCSKQPTNEATSESNSGATTGKPYASKGNEGTVAGVVAFNGTPAAPKKIDTSTGFPNVLLARPKLEFSEKIEVWPLAEPAATPRFFR